MLNGLSGDATPRKLRDASEVDGPRGRDTDARMTCFVSITCRLNSGLLSVLHGANFDYLKDAAFLSSHGTFRNVSKEGP